MGGFQSRHFWDEFLTYFSAGASASASRSATRYYDFNRRVPEKHRSR